MPKIHTFTGEKVFEKEIRTITWFKSVLKKSSTTNPTQFGTLIRDLKGEFGEGKRQWHNYGKKYPALTMTPLKVWKSSSLEQGIFLKMVQKKAFYFELCLKMKNNISQKQLDAKQFPLKGYLLIHIV